MSENCNQMERVFEASHGIAFSQNHGTHNRVPVFVCHMRKAPFAAACANAPGVRRPLRYDTAEPRDRGGGRTGPGTAHIISGKITILAAHAEPMTSTPGILIRAQPGATRPFHGFPGFQGK